jgi:hypothetical protein
VLAEIVLIFAVFAIQGAWPVPEVNEPYYLGKAVHFWNPEWLRGDFFIESPDTHKVFCFTFGWLSLWLTPTALALAGRVVSWALLAWAWRRLSFAIVPRAWCSVLTAALFGCLMERCHMAGEWVIGGVEAKPFAYAFVFLGIESLVRNRWNRALLLFGLASAFHALVGGWAAVAAGIAWLWCARATKCSPHPNPLPRGEGTEQNRGPHPSPLPKGEGTEVVAPPLRSLWPGILGGLLLSLPGLIPSLTLDWGTNAETARAAHQIYVFERLPHHLTLTGMRLDFILRLALLWTFWLLLGRWSRRAATPEEQPSAVTLLRAFVAGAVTITLVGAVINTLAFFDCALAADLLRYYWFRLTDVVLPLGVALEGVALTVRGRKGTGPCFRSGVEELGGVDWPKNGPVPAGHGQAMAQRGEKSWRIARGALTLAILAAAFQVGSHVIERIWPESPRSHKTAGFADWYAACRWVAESGKIPRDAQFLVPRLAGTFSWYSGRRAVVDWKDVPQDAKTLVEWRRRIETIYATGFPDGPRWYDPLAEVGAKRLRELGAKYNADFVITERTDPLVGLDVVYENGTYVIYRLK